VHEKIQLLSESAADLFKRIIKNTSHFMTTINLVCWLLRSNSSGCKP